MLLSEIKTGSKTKIKSVDAGRGLTARLAAMGLIPGTEISVITNDKKGPVVIVVKESKIALGRKMAEQIQVM